MSGSLANEINAVEKSALNQIQKLHKYGEESLLFGKQKSDLMVNWLDISSIVGSMNVT